jgi:hypothetical protein
MSTTGNGFTRDRIAMLASGDRSTSVPNRNGRNGKAALLAPLDPLGATQDKLVSLDGVASSEVQWLVPNIIPLGSITVMDGQKSEGKSAVTYNLAAHITAATSVPFCGGKPVGGGVIVLEAEDDLGATVKASIKASGGDTKKIIAYTKAEPLYLDNPKDLALIATAAREINARLLVVDPFSEFFHATLKDEKAIRSAFRPLRKLAADLQLAVILVRHFTKAGTNPLYRGLGGVAVINSARAALVVGHDPSSDDPYRHVLAVNRCNLPRTREVSLSYSTVKQGDAIVIEWLGESRYSADDMVAAAQSPDAHSQLEEACYILYSILVAHEGPMPATDVFEAAKAGLVSVGTLKRAKKMLRVRSRRKLAEITKDDETTVVVQWVWQLPDDEELLRPYEERLERDEDQQTK